MFFLLGLLSAIEPAYPSPDLSSAPTDHVRVEICESGLPAANAWPLGKPPIAAETFDSPAFAFTKLPHKYIDTGVRADRPNPFLLRAIARVTLPAGEHRILLRGRGAARLFIDGKLVLNTPFPPSLGDGSDGRDPSTWDYLNLGPNFRFAPPGNRENWCRFKSNGSEQLIVMETVIGGVVGKKSRRPEPGETVVAVALAGSESFDLLSNGKRLPYTDETWPAIVAEEESRIEKLDSERRARAFSTQKSHWQARRADAANWLLANPTPKVPALPKAFTAANPVDQFIAAKIATAASTGKEGKIQFGKDVRPILEAKCFSCHQGAKAKAGLSLDKLSSAIIPGKPDTSDLIARITTTDAAEVMPPQGARLSETEVATLKQWISEGALYTDRPGRVTEMTDDFAFLRRVTLDTVGMVPTSDEIAAFRKDRSADRRAKVIEHLLADPRRAGHWVSYWQDVLAENPNILNPTLNNTGPFRWWLHEAFLDNKPFDVLVTELVRLRGSERDGGPAGFGVASENDVPMAEKAVTVASAFLGANMKCARCHDAPANRATQQELFQLAGLLAGKPLKVPATSSVPLDKLGGGGRQSLIKVTLKPGTTVAPSWPFADFLKATSDTPQSVASRDQLAAWLTDPRNERFAQVAVNRVWKRLMGIGLVEPADDWERGEPTHPELLAYLAREFVKSGYDLRHVERLILNSHAYQRAADSSRNSADVYFASPVRRRLAAEQVVDSLFAAAGKPLQVGELSLDIDGARDLGNSISLGVPKRAWEFASTSNERDRPSLALPRVQAVVDLLSVFGWRATRQDALTDRDASPDVLQPAALSNGTVAVWLTRLTDDHSVTKLALEAKSPSEFVDALFLRVLTRLPSEREKAALVEHLSAGFESRVVSNPPKPMVNGPRVRPRYVSWSNHLTPGANDLKTEFERAARKGETPTAKLTAEWRERAEDVLWALLNMPEFVFTP